MKEKLFGIQSYGKYNFEMDIMVDAGRQLDDADRNSCRKLAEAIRDIIEGRTIELDPEMQAASRLQRQDILECFPNSVYWIPVENGYHGNTAYGRMFPWYRITTNRGIFTVGWRKNVINLDWSETNIKSSSDELFADEYGTKGYSYIHAYSYQKLKEYVSTLMESK